MMLRMPGAQKIDESMRATEVTVLSLLCVGQRRNRVLREYSAGMEVIALPCTSRNTQNPTSTEL